ncbi:MAG: response regulator [Bacteroidetes bacterium]|nr:response regulator [Bacteroidota bacterium]
MNTKKILLVTSDIELSGIIRISALTLTKLNCQVAIDESSDENDIIKRSGEENIDMIIFDSGHETLDIKEIIGRIRSDSGSTSKKIITVYTGDINREEFFNAGCDSIMSKDEFKKAVNNILQH